MISLERLKLESSYSVYLYAMSQNVMILFSIAQSKTASRGSSAVAELLG